MFQDKFDVEMNNKPFKEFYHLTLSKKEILMKEKNIW